MSTKKINRLYVLDELEDSIDHLDLSKAVPAQFPNLKTSTETHAILDELTKQAQELGLDY